MEMTATQNLIQHYARQAWAIEMTRGLEVLAALEARFANGSRSEPFLSAGEVEANAKRARVQTVPMAPAGKNSQQQNVAIIPMFGTILPRGSAMAEMSGGGAVSLMRFQGEFNRVANDPSIGAIILEFDSPGGHTSLVQETAKVIYEARKKGRPIVAVANTMMASAAYWLASACDELVASPSSTVGSIGVFGVHEDHSQRLAAMGVHPTFIFEGPRKVEGNRFEPLSDTARAAIQESVRFSYEQFTSDVARYRGADVAAVRADPEGATGKHFGGGRSYDASHLAAMGMVGRGGMVDRIDTMQAVVEQLAGRQPSRKSVRRRRLAMM